MTKIIMHGCNGKMGKVISKLILTEKDCEIVAGIDINNISSYNYPIFKTIDDCTVNADVIIDFSTASAVDQLLEYTYKNKIPLVLCTTGLSQEQINKINEYSQKAPIFFSANMSLGINLLINLVKKASKILTDANFDIEIIEKHHNQKIDAPSGTALAIANSINDSLNNKYDYKFDRSNERTKRSKKEIGIHAIRGGSIVGEHTVLYAGQDELIEIKHTALSKEIFAIGSIKAAKYMNKKEAGLYSMEDLIESAQ